MDIYNFDGYEQNRRVYGGMSGRKWVSQLMEKIFW